MKDFFSRNKAATILGLVLLSPILVFTLWAAITLNYTYSKGDRAGILQKFSQKGWICKTWEGELLMSAVPGSAPEKFLFSVRSDSIAREVNRLNGRRVVLYYEEHRGIPTSCFGDTDYFVNGVRAMADSVR
ncbi:MAG TPA: hypothetical protein VFO55_08770 [Gemmatimonadaceae bacterium]|nr:hypothetical protein [Gemmatimonadaceae bacterium]